MRYRIFQTLSGEQINWLTSSAGESGHRELIGPDMGKYTNGNIRIVAMVTVLLAGLQI
jgi:hypothetical protein